MKRTVLFILLSLLLLFFASFRLATPAYAAGALLGGEGRDIMSYNDTMIGFVIGTMGACSDTDVPGTLADDILYYAQSTANFVSQYSPGACPTALNYKHSALSGLSSSVLAIYSNPPASTQQFAMDLGQTLGFIPHQVEAQGIGFSGLQILLPIWKAFRDVAYILLAIILIIIGFMVMFRKKIDPKTVVTVQNALPRVVIALLLVTFSYAIVGFMIDLMYLVIVLAVNVIVGAATSPGGNVNSFGALISGLVWKPTWLDPSSWFPKPAPVTVHDVTDLLLNGGLGGLLRFFFGAGFSAVDDIGKLLTGNWNPGVKIAATAVWGIMTFLFAGGGTKGLAVAGLAYGPVLLNVLVLIILIFGLIRLVFMLVDAYINIIISLLFSPFQLMLEAIPGTNAFSSWFRWLIAKIITFPLTAVLLLIAAFLTSQENATKLWAPPLLSSGSGVTGVSGFIGLGMLLVIPNVVASIQKAMKAEPFIPGGLGTVLGPVGSGVGQLFQMGYQASFIGSAIRHKPDARSPVQTLREGSQKGFTSITGQGEGH